jgi:AcrR family transcriptional regulator
MNVAQGLVYHYFKSKTEILYAVIDELADEHLKAIEALLSGTQGTALDRLSIFLSSQPDFDKFDKLIPSIANDSAIAEYCSNKMATSTGPLLLSLIEQGNADGSWNCEYPKETAVFILRGVNGLFTDLPFPGADTRMKKVFTNMFARILGFSQE